MNEVDEIKDRIDIVQFVSSYLQLQKAGANYKAQCPFHAEKTASLMVSPEKQIFKCFGCDAGGDVIEFLMRIENLNFPEALEMLAQRTGVTLQKKGKSKAQYKQDQDVKTAIYKINDLSSRVFHKLLKEHKVAKEAREYLKNRKINDKIIDKFQIGYAPKQRVLESFLVKRGFSQRQMRQAGDPQKKFYDRVVFPIKDRLGNTVGFTGRTLQKDHEPKYLNTPESVIFHKSKVMYGLSLAKDEIKEKKEVIVMEGQMDVVLSHKAGVGNVVASSGTALTAQHLKILSRYTSNIVFCFDGDLAGREAQKKAIKISYENDISPKVISLPDGFKDAGEIIESDAELWKEVVSEKQSAMEWLISSYFDGQSDSGKKKEIAKEICGYVVAITDPLEKNHYKKMLAKYLSVSERIVDEIIERIQNKSRDRSFGSNIESPEVKTKSKSLITEEVLLGDIFCKVDLVKVVASELKIDDIQDDIDVKEVYRVIIDCYNEKSKVNEKVDGKKILECVEKKIDKDLSDKVAFLVMKSSDRLNRVEDKTVESEVLDCIAKIKSGRNQEIKDNFAKRIAQAEKKGDRKKVMRLLKKLQESMTKK